MEFFNLKRTKMVDEAAYNHKPQRLIMTLFIFYLVYFIAQLLSNVIVSIASMFWLLNDKEFISFMKEYMEATMSGEFDADYFTAVINSVVARTPSWIVAVSLIAFVMLIATAIFYCLKIEKRPLSSLGIRKGSFLKEYGIGVGIGLGMAGIAVLIAFLCGSVSIKANPDGISPLIILFFVGFLIQGAAEELMFRGYYMITVARDYKVAIAVLVSSVVFSLAHTGNGGFNFLAFVNILLFGIFLGVYVFKRGDIWGACAIHSMWNFATGCIFGTSVSGMQNMSSFLVAEINESKTLANGGSFGLEGGISATIVLLIAVCLVFLIKPNKKEISVTEC